MKIEFFAVSYEESSIPYGKFLMLADSAAIKGESTRGDSNSFI
jgi:hypothetical protein